VGSPTQHQARALTAALLLVALPATSARAEVNVESEGSCLTQDLLVARLEQVLRAEARSRSARLVLSVRGQTSGAGTRVTLTARTPWGETLLERRYELSEADCGSATELLALVLERFLASFPAERWSALLRRARETARPRRLEVSLQAAASVELAPTGGDLELGAAVEYGSPRHGIGGSLILRGGLPRSLGQGRFGEATLLAGLRYRLGAFAWQPALELRVGPGLLYGTGYDESYQRVVPCLEVVASVERRFRRFALGLQLRATLIRHRVSTEDQSYSESLPILAAGLRLSFPVLGRDL
jgi:hypothetical protein